MPPRNDLLLLGIDYRRIPVLAINDTVYCDTFKIAEALESLYPPSDQHPSLFPIPSTSPHQRVALQKTLVQFWADRALFRLAVALIPWDHFPKSFIADREQMLGHQIDVKKIKESKPYTLSQFRLHLNLVEEMLRESTTDFIMDTNHPGFLDVSIYFTLRWILKIGVDQQTLYGPQCEGNSKYQSVQNWMKGMEAFYQSNKGNAPSTEISGSEANQMIPEPSQLNFDGSPDDERLLGLGEHVAVAPDDTGKVPTTGKLVGLDGSNIVLIVKRRDGTNRECKVCFPRLGFNIVPEYLKTSQL